MNLDFFDLEITNLWNKPQGPKPEVDRARLESAHAGLTKKFEAQEVGFFDWPVNCPAESVQKMREHAAFLRANFDGALILGIGGSFLGPYAVAEALRTEEDKKAFELIWLSNVDRDAMERAKVKMAGKKFAAVVTSKSGGTVETLSAFFHLAPSLDPKGIVAITDPVKGELRRLATANQWTSFEVPPNIGGRFSVLSAVGLFPVFLANLDAEKLLTGAAKMRERLKAAPHTQNPAYILAMAHHEWDTAHGHSTHYWMPYQMSLRALADWNIQLWGESLGKKQLADGKAVGFTPVSAVGSTDQHSLLQLFKEGPNNKLVGFIDVFEQAKGLTIGKPPFEIQDLAYICEHTFDEINHLASLATEKSLSNSGVPTYRITVKEVTLETIGALFFFWETACAFAGELYGVNAFDQPGVEEAKRLLRESL